MTVQAAKRKLGELITTLRKQCGVGVRALAQKSRVHKKHILNMQCGTGPFIKDVVQRVIDALKIQNRSSLSQVQEYMNIIWPVRGPVVRSALI